MANLRNSKLYQINGAATSHLKDSGAPFERTAGSILQNDQLQHKSRGVLQSAARNIRAPQYEMRTLQTDCAYSDVATKNIDRRMHLKNSSVANDFVSLNFSRRPIRQKIAGDETETTS